MSPCSFPLAGKNPQEAVHNFIIPLQGVLSCFSASAHLSHIGPYEVTGGPFALVIDKFKLPGSTIYLSASMNYTIVHVKEDADRGPFKVKTTAYQYMLTYKDEQEIFAYQWHPDSQIKFPHLHLGSSAKISSKTLNKLHLPTGRIALEQVLRLTVDELGVKPIKGKWDSILTEAQSRFEKWRTWS